MLKKNIKEEQKDQSVVLDKVHVDNWSRLYVTK